MIPSRLSCRLLIVIASSLWIFFAFNQLARRWDNVHLLQFHGGEKAYGSEASRLDLPRVPCYGARGKLLSKSVDDMIYPTELDIPYVKEFGGSYDALNLEKTWMTADGRYGAYGYREQEPGYNRSRVNWDNVDWAELQNICLARNKKRVPQAVPINNRRRFRLRTALDTVAPPTYNITKTGRTALVLRSWVGYDYSDKDLIHLRSVITEGALDSGGEYAAVIVVHVHDRSLNIFQDEAKYNAVLETAVPEEFRNMTILFDDNLVESWYPSIPEHKPEYQMYEALQLLAQFYPEFDYFWQLELDIRYTGHVGKYLDAMSKFAREDPRKQARERASYYYFPEVHGPYEEFLKDLDEAMEGGGVWGPVWIPDIEPIGPEPPTQRPEADDFVWGVGEDADVLVTNPCADVLKLEDWVYRDWIGNFEGGDGTPRITSVPAITRTSRVLLNAIHYAQAEKGLYLQSEATPASFALWHGLKLSLPPQPWWQEEQRDQHGMAEFFNGGPPSKHKGISFGEGIYNASQHGEIVNTGTWWWSSGFPHALWDRWLENDATNEEKLLPHLLRRHEGQIWAPNAAIHPVKTNGNPLR